MLVSADKTAITLKREVFELLDEYRLQLKFYEADGSAIYSVMPLLAQIKGRMLVIARESDLLAQSDFQEWIERIPCPILLTE